MIFPEAQYLSRFSFLLMAVFSIVVYGLFAVSEILISRLLRSNAADTQQADARSLRLIWLMALVSLTAAIIVTVTTQLPIATTSIVHTIGLILMLLGMAFRWSVIWSLGRLFTADVAIRKSHTLKTDGFYRYLRHPSYTALALTFLGLGVSLNNWLALVVLLPIIPALFNRIRIEEQTLIRHFGQLYLDYMRRTKALIPFVY